MEAQINIPIYRALKLGTEDEWVGGWLVPYIPEQGLYYLISSMGENIQIDPKTLAIHFPNMTDKNGKKIFASLSEDGVGGDICTDGYKEQYICTFNKITNSCVMQYWTKQMQKETMGVCDHYWQTFKVIGINE